MTLPDLGWRDAFAAAFTPYTETCIPARVVLEQKNLYRVLTPDGEWPALVTGRFTYEAATRMDYPVVGDWVAATLAGDTALIHAVLPRRSLFARKEAGARTAAQPVAANVDTALLVMGLDDNYRLGRIERYLALAWESGAEPVVLLTKADLCPEVETRVAAVEAAAPGVPVHALSVYSGDGLAALTDYLQPGQTVVLLGSSGVGKSTLVNHLLGEARQRVNEIRAADGRGRHTTTHRQLFLLPGRALLIDTPGMRELQLWHADDGLAETFADIDALAAECRFVDCEHGGEPGCRVQAAVSAGTLDPQRLERYYKLRKELAFLQLREEQGVAQAERARWKAVSREIKRLNKH